MKNPFLSIVFKNMFSIRYFINLQLSYRASFNVDYRLVSKIETWVRSYKVDTVSKMLVLK